MSVLGPSSVIEPSRSTKWIGRLRPSYTALQISEEALGEIKFPMPEVCGDCNGARKTETDFPTFSGGWSSSRLNQVEFLYV